MSTGKNPYRRYRIINSCLTSKQQRFWTSREFIERLAENDLRVTLRMLKYDLEAMRHDKQLGFSAPIAYCPRNRGYYYTDPDYSIDVVPLNETDVQVLTIGVDILQQYKGADIVKQFETAIEKIIRVVGHLKMKNQVQVISFENTPYYKGHECFDDLLTAAQAKQPLSISYKKFTGDDRDDHVFHPYHMKEYKGRWYVLGFSEARNNIITLGLDRVENVSEATVSFCENTTLDLAKHFEHTIGITYTPGEPQCIELLFSPGQAPYVKTQHLHHTQKTIKEDENGLQISLVLRPNYELISLILSYGSGVEVLKPVSLREQVKVEVGKMGRVYR